MIDEHDQDISGIDGGLNVGELHVGLIRQRSREFLEAGQARHEAATEAERNRARQLRRVAVSAVVFGVGSRAALVWADGHIERFWAVRI